MLFILYPNNLFARRLAYKEFNIYSGRDIKGDYQAVLDKAVVLVRASELYESGYTYDILLTDETFYKDVSFKILGPSLARSIDNNIMLNIRADFENNLLSGPRNKRDLTRTIAHEMVHCLQMNRYGILKFNPFKHPPLWKQEGYPEYIAYQEEINSPAYSFTETVRVLKDYEKKRATWVELKPGHFDPMIYFKGRVMIEYLMNIKRMNYDQILRDEIQEENVYKELDDWYTSQPVTNNE